MADHLSPEQQHAAEEFRKLRGVDPFGPFIPLLKSPELMLRAGALGEYLRFRSALPPRLSELAILVTAAHWRQQFEWEIHAPIALNAGVPQETIDALWGGSHPSGLAADQEALYELCVQLHRDRKPTREILARANATLGERGVIDAIGICGYYTLLAMVLNSDAH